jgi:hypothetical protein
LNYLMSLKLCLFHHTHSLLRYLWLYRKRERKNKKLKKKLNVQRDP